MKVKQVSSRIRQQVRGFSPVQHATALRLCATALLLASRLAMGADYFVCQDQGCDTNAGTIAAPFRTILHAVKQAGAGDTVNLVPGERPWRESVALNTHPTWYHPGGEPGNPLVIDGHGSWITGADPCPPDAWNEEDDGVWTHRGMNYSAFMVIEGELAWQVSHRDVAEPGELYYLNHGHRLFYRTRPREPMPVIEIGQPDGVAITIDPKDWQNAGHGLVRYIGTTPPAAELVPPTWIKIAGVDRPLVQPRDRLEPGQFAVEDGVLHYRPPQGKQPPDMDIEAVVRGSGVYMGGNTSHVVIRNFNVRHVWNDGYNIHGGCKDISFFNCNAEDCGDEGFSSHGTCETLLDGGVFLRCDNGINNVNSAVSITRNVIIAGSRSTGYEGQQDSRHTVENLILIDNKNQLSCPNITGENILIANIDKGSMYTVSAGGKLENVTLIGEKADYRMLGLGPGQKLTLIGSRFEKAGTIHIRDTEPTNLTISNSVFHPDTVVEWGAKQPFKTMQLADAAKDATLPFAGAGMIEQPVLAPLTRGERPAVIPEDSGCTPELIERYLEFMKGWRKQ